MYCLWDWIRIIAKLLPLSLQTSSVGFKSGHWQGYRGMIRVLSWSYLVSYLSIYLSIILILIKNINITTKSLYSKKQKKNQAWKSVWELITDSSSSVRLVSRDCLMMGTFSPVLHSSLLPPRNFLFREHELNFLQCCQVECALMGFQIAPDQLLSPSFLPSGDYWLARNDFLIFSPLKTWCLRAPLCWLNSPSGWFDCSWFLSPASPVSPTTYWHFHSVAEWSFVSVSRRHSHTLSSWPDRTWGGSCCVVISWEEPLVCHLTEG